MVKKCTEKCAACEEWLFCLSKPVAILEVLVAVAVVISQTPCQISAPNKNRELRAQGRFYFGCQRFNSKGTRL